MNRTGHYEYVPQEGWVRVSDDIPCVSHRDAWMPKGDVKYFDKSAKRWFHSRAEKRQWLTSNGMREGGVITNPDKRWDGPTRNPTKPTFEQRKSRERAQEWVKSQGGTEGLLSRTQRGG